MPISLAAGTKLNPNRLNAVVRGHPLDEGRRAPHIKLEHAFQEPAMTDQTTLDAIEKAVNANDVVLFMKGTPTFPQCGFSSVVVQVLDYLGVEYVSTNVLEDAAVREGIKAYSQWPTIPQLYVKGEFVGGCDIVKEMFESGELRDFFQDKGVEVEAA
jgi:monothiol glutaredoxin